MDTEYPEINENSHLLINNINYRLTVRVLLYLSKCCFTKHIPAYLTKSSRIIVRPIFDRMTVKTAPVTKNTHSIEKTIENIIRIANDLFTDDLT